MPDAPDLEPALQEPSDLSPTLGGGNPLDEIVLSIKINGGPWRDLGTIKDVREGHGDWPTS